ncbi:DNA topoisomerase [Coprobacillaceae bacterium CR2/5/TPMF4]|nr:DNA topoisomerase [Coprobacillaceae bacterium CR2/5/TPMF4]
MIPTEQPVMLGAFSDSEFKIYDLVLKRFLAVLLPPYIYKKTTIKAKVNQETFTTSGKIEIQSGWQQIYNHDNTEQFEQVLPLMKENDQYVVSEIKKPVVKLRRQHILTKLHFYQQWKIRFTIPIINLNS